jgi:hypothetical protein
MFQKPHPGIKRCSYERSSSYSGASDRNLEEPYNVEGRLDQQPAADLGRDDQRAQVADAIDRLSSLAPASKGSVAWGRNCWRASTSGAWRASSRPVQTSFEQKETKSGSRDLSGHATRRVNISSSSVETTPSFGRHACPPRVTDSGEWFLTTEGTEGHRKGPMERRFHDW